MSKHPDLELKMTQMINCLEAARTCLDVAYVQWLYVSSYTFSADIPVPEFGDQILEAKRIIGRTWHDVLETDFEED